MLGSVQNVFKIPELKNRILFTLGMIIVYRLGAHIPTPGLNAGALAKLFGEQSGILAFLDMFSGGALRNFSIFALGIAPYINASIIMQLLIYVWPYLEKLSKEDGDEGRKKISQYTRYGTVFLSVIQALGISFMLERSENVVLSPGWAFRLNVIITLTAGAAFTMWLGEKITEKGIGNGISLLIFAGIVSRLPSALITTYAKFKTDPMMIPKMVILLLIVVGIIGGVIFVTEGIRKISVQYAKRVKGRKVWGGVSTYIPLKVNQAGVIPVIFASSILMFPPLVGKIIQPYVKWDWLVKFIEWFNYGSAIYLVCYSVLIMFFTYFYTAITFNPIDLAKNMKKNSGFIPGIRPGRPTSEYIDRILTRTTFAGALFLAIISIFPMLLIKYAEVPFYFGGTALLIVVGVALDTMKQMETHLVQRHYSGFMRK